MQVVYLPMMAAKWLAHSLIFFVPLALVWAGLSVAAK